MQHRALDILKEEARVTPVTMSRREKLSRWMTALEALGETRLRTLWGVEYAPQQDRLPQRQDQSPLAVAFADPTLRAAGLRDDTYGAALAFFELSDGQLHRLTCRCEFGSQVAASRVSRRLRGMINNPVARMREAVAAFVARHSPRAA